MFRLILLAVLCFCFMFPGEATGQCVGGVCPAPPAPVLVLPAPPVPVRVAPQGHLVPVQPIQPQAVQPQVYRRYYWTPLRNWLWGRYRVQYIPVR